MMVKAIVQQYDSKIYGVNVAQAAAAADAPRNNHHSFDHGWLVILIADIQREACACSNSGDDSRCTKVTDTTACHLQDCGNRS
jgi:hypothetical protein